MAIEVTGICKARKKKYSALILRIFFIQFFNFLPFFLCCNVLCLSLGQD